MVARVLPVKPIMVAGLLSTELFVDRPLSIVDRLLST
jgi:hypothetical protein